MSGYNNGNNNCPAMRASMSSSLPSIFRSGGGGGQIQHHVQQQAAGVQQHQERRRSGPDHRRLVSTECQTDREVARHGGLGGGGDEEDCPRLAVRSRPVSQVSSQLDVQQDQRGEEILSAGQVSSQAGRQRQRQRREKRRRARQQQQQQTTTTGQQPLQQHVQLALEAQTDLSQPGQPVSPSHSGDHLPDILNAHMPPPYSTLPHNSERCMGMGPLPAPLLAGTNLPIVPPGLTVPMHPITPHPGPSVSPGGPAGLMATNSFNLPPPGGRRYDRILRCFFFFMTPAGFLLTQ